jgi:hypothetical protein
MTMQRLAAFSFGLLFLPFSADAALMYIDPPQGQYGRGDTFMLSVRLEPEDECVNAAHVEVAYPKETLRAVDFSRGDSIFSLWVEEPKIDLERGVVTFSGGIPGGYCGRIKGDPVLTNVLGKIVFTAINTDESEARVALTESSVAYLNDGGGTLAPLSRAEALFQLATTAQTSGNPWLTEVGEDAIPPEAFTIEIQSTRDVFDGHYYAVFSTLDKQSGIDHYEIFEKDVWKPVTSPHRLYDQSLRSGVQIKAIDKAGNERFGEYVEGSAPPRLAWPVAEYALIALFICAVIGWFVFGFHRRKPEAVETPPSEPQA